MRARYFDVMADVPQQALGLFRPYGLGAVEALIEPLKNGKADADIASVLRELSSLLIVQEEKCHAIKCGVVALLVSRLHERRHSQEESGGQRNIAESTRPCETVEKSLVDGKVSSTLSELPKGSKNETGLEVALLIMASLQEIAKDLQGRKNLYDQDALVLMLELYNHSQANEVLAITKLFEVISRFRDGRKYLLRQEGLMESLVDRLSKIVDISAERKSESTAVMTISTLSTIQNLTCVPEGAEAAFEVGLLPILNCLLKAFTQNVTPNIESSGNRARDSGFESNKGTFQTLACCLKALWNLICQITGRDEALRLGTLLNILEALQICIENVEIGPWRREVIECFETGSGVLGQLNTAVASKVQTADKGSDTLLRLLESDNQTIRQNIIRIIQLSSEDREALQIWTSKLLRDAPKLYDVLGASACSALNELLQSEITSIQIDALNFLLYILLKDQDDGKTLVACPPLVRSLVELYAGGNALVMDTVLQLLSLLDKRYGEELANIVKRDEYLRYMVQDSPPLSQLFDKLT